MSRYRLKGFDTLPLIALALWAGAAGANGQSGFHGWLGLYTPEQLAWLENENRLGALCRNVENLAACQAWALAPMVTTYLLHTAPDTASPRVGELIVVAVPGRGLSAHYREADSGQAIRFQPDLFLQDWGYGPFFHQTVIHHQGDWFQLPPLPWDETVWLQHSAGTLRYLQKGDIVAFRGDGMVVVDAEPEALRLRAEQPADHWCQMGEPPPLQPAVTARYTRDELSDRHGHLIVRPKYLKGC
jgi:hypothetical protein